MSYLGNVQESLCNINKGTNTLDQTASTCTTLFMKNNTFDSSFHSQNTTHTINNEILCASLSIGATRILRGSVVLSNTSNVTTKCGSAASTIWFSANPATQTLANTVQNNSDFHNILNGLPCTVTLDSLNCYNGANPNLGLKSLESFTSRRFLLKD